MDSNQVFPLSDLTQDHIPQLGSAAPALNRLNHARLSTLPGFVISSQFAYYYQGQGSLSTDRTNQIIQAYSQFAPQLDKSLLLTSLNQSRDLSIPTYDLANSESTLFDSLYRLWDIHPGCAVMAQLLPDIQYSGIIIYKQSASGSRQAHLWINRGYWHPTAIPEANFLLINLETGSTVSRETRQAQFFSQVQGAQLITRQAPQEDFLNEHLIENLTSLARNVDKAAHEFNLVHFVVSDNQTSVQSLEQARYHDILELEQLYDKKKFNSPIARGTAHSPGLVSAPLHYLSNGVIDDSLAGYIIAAPTISPDQIHFHPRGLITAQDSYTSALAIFARHHHIPLLSIPDFNSFSSLVKGQTVVLDAHLGSLSLPEHHQTRPTDALPKTKTQTFLQATNLISDPHSDGTFAPLSSVWQTLMGLNYSQLQSANLSHTSARLAELLVAQSLLQSPNQFIVAPSVQSTDYIDAELYAIRAARKQASNLHLALPPLTTLEQFRIAKKQLYYYGLKRSASFKFYLQLHSPATVWHLSQFHADGLDGVIIDVDQLIQAFYANQVPNPQDPHILEIFEHLITQANHKLRLDCYIVGDTVAYDPELTQKFIKWGVTGIIVTHDRLDSIRQDIARNEVNISKNKHRLRKRKSS